MTPRLIVYFDGLCPLCSREINHYRKQAPVGQVQFQDITDPEFQPETHGLDREAIHQHMHVRLDGKIRTGVQAFFAIWEVIPGYKALRTFLSLPGVYWLATILYSVFARVRPMLPKRKCVEGVCRV
jgi:predicted DCC family thiol-disulfide oxidoreductase YuxK